MEVVVKEQAAPAAVEMPKAEPEDRGPINQINDTHKMYLVNFFELEGQALGKTTTDRLVAINDYLAETVKTDAEYLNQLKQLRLKLGSPRLGETMLGKIYSYLKLINQRSDLDQQLMEAETNEARNSF